MNKIICIVGPTASGKTALGIKIAKKFNGEVVSADSRMVYRGMEIGTATPLGNFQFPISNFQYLVVEGIPHYLIGIVEPNQPFTVVDWRQQAIVAIDDILKREKLPIVVGGTGLYFSALVDNFDIPAGKPNEQLRKEIEKEWQIKNHQSKIINQLLAVDPDAKERVDLNNPRRVIRALEVCKATGKPFTQQLHKQQPLYEALEIGLQVPREVLEKRLAGRTAEQLQDGLLKEVKWLKKQYGCKIPPMQGFVYKQMCQYLNGELTLEKAIELINLRNRQYAKRQMSWFRRDKRIQWIQHPGDAQRLIQSFVEPLSE